MGTRTTSTGNSQFVNDLTGVDNLGAGTLPTAGTSYSEWALLSYLGRANYNLLDRYLFTLTARRDGSFQGILLAGISPRYFTNFYRQMNLGPQGLVEMVQRDDVDMVLGAIVGAAGLPAVFAAVRAGKPLALASACHLRRDDLSRPRCV